MIITDKDKEVLQFIEKFKVASTSTISELYYKNLKWAQRRLKKLYDNKYLKRDRDHFTSEYYYYIKKTKQWRHDLLLTNFYKEMNQLVKIEVFEKEIPIGDIRPDGIIGYRYKGKSYFACIEIQIANIALDVEKYERLFKSGRYKRYFPVFPLIYVISDRNIPDTNLKIIRINEDMSNLRSVLI